MQKQCREGEMQISAASRGDQDFEREDVLWEWTDAGAVGRCDAEAIEQPRRSVGARPQRRRSVRREREEDRERSRDGVWVQGHSGGEV